jgi:hypothetical protein
MIPALAREKVMGYGIRYPQVVNWCAIADLNLETLRPNAILLTVRS